jgi:hypothetical protein
MLPEAERAVVEEKKILDYLLSTDHPDGKLKAAFFTVLVFHGKTGRSLLTLCLSMAKRML